MRNEYDHLTAYHYAQYRPPLHEKILASCLGGASRFHSGLDIGCGTGRSTVALRHHCETVIGIDPSAEMLKKATAQLGITYQWFDGESLAFSPASFEIITFAGSLYYAKSQQLADEVIRVCKPGAKVVVYDFEVHLKDLLASMIATPLPEVSEAYDHAVDFSGLRLNGVVGKQVMNGEIMLQLTHQQVTHLLLSDLDFCQTLSDEFGTQELEASVNQQLKQLHPHTELKIKADTYCCVYEVE